MKLIIQSFSATAFIVIVIISLYKLVMTFPAVGVALWLIGLFSFLWFLVWFVMWASKD